MSELRFEIAGLFISNGKGRHVTLATDTTELIFVKSGTLHIRVGETHYAVSQGQWLIMPCGIEHGGTEEYERKLSFFWGHFYGGEEELAKAIPYGTSLRRENFLNYFTILTNEQKYPDSQQTCNLLMKILLNETCRNAPSENNDPLASNLAQGAKRILDLKFASQVGSSDVAKELNCNVDYLGRIFRRAFSCTMIDYLNTKRCEEAATLLRYGTSSVKEIAFFCGFNDLAYFRRQFFRRYSMTPVQYRQLHKTEYINTMNVGVMTPQQCPH